MYTLLIMGTVSDETAMNPNISAGSTNSTVSDSNQTSPDDDNHPGVMSGSQPQKSVDEVSESDDNTLAGASNKEPSLNGTSGGLEKNNNTGARKVAGDSSPPLENRNYMGDQKAASAPISPSDGPHSDTDSTVPSSASSDSEDESVSYHSGSTLGPPRATVIEVRSSGSRSGQNSGLAALVTDKNATMPYGFLTCPHEDCGSTCYFTNLTALERHFAMTGHSLGDGNHMVSEELSPQSQESNSKGQEKGLLVCRSCPEKFFSSMDAWIDHSADTGHRLRDERITISVESNVKQAKSQTEASARRVLQINGRCSPSDTSDDEFEC